MQRYFDLKGSIKNRKNSKCMSINVCMTCMICIDSEAKSNENSRNSHKNRQPSIDIFKKIDNGSTLSSI